MRGKNKSGPLWSGDKRNLGVPWHVPGVVTWGRSRVVLCIEEKRILSMEKSMN